MVKSLGEISLEAAVSALLFQGFFYLQKRLIWSKMPIQIPWYLITLYKKPCDSFFSSSALKISTIQ